MRGIVQQTLEKIRTESRLLHPVILDDFGLEKALEWYVEQFGRQHGIAARFLKGGPIGVISPEATIHIYRIVQEALTNVSRHSGIDARPGCGCGRTTTGSSSRSRIAGRGCRRRRSAGRLAGHRRRQHAGARRQLMGGELRAAARPIRRGSS